MDLAKQVLDKNETIHSEKNAKIRADKEVNTYRMQIEGVKFERDKLISENKKLNLEISDFTQNITNLQNKTKNFEEILEKNKNQEIQLLSKNKSIGKF